MAITLSRRAFDNVIELRNHRRSGVSPQEVLAALLGQHAPLSAILGRHPSFPNEQHPTHTFILRTLVERTAGRIAGDTPDLAADDLLGSAVIVGGPIASRHAAALFGTATSASVLGIDLPVRFDLTNVKQNSRRPETRAGLLIEGRSSIDECFLLTSLPMRDHRLVNISALTTAGGDAADLVLGDAKIIHDLHVRTRPLAQSGWQALFRVRVKGGKPIAVDSAFDLFEVRGLDSDSLENPLNNPDFLFEYSEAPKIEKIAERQSSVYTHYVAPDPELDELTERIKTYLKRNPENAGKASARIMSALSEFSVAASAKLSIPSNRPQWSDKTARQGRSPAQFIRDEYRKEIEAGELTLPSIRRADPGLYQAYISWIRPSRHPEDDMKLPTRTDRATMELEAIEGMDLASIERLHRLAGNARSRALRQRR